VTGLARYQAAILLRSHRWLFPLIPYGLLIAVGDQGATPLAGGLDWSAAMLVPAVALLTRSILTAEPDAARAVVAAAAGPGKAQLAALSAALGGGAVLGLAGACFEVLASQPAAAGGHGGTLAKVSATAAHPQVLVAGLAVALVCLLVGSAAGALCNPPLLRHPGVTLLSTLTAVVVALVAGISPAAAALRSPGRGAGAGAAPHWPGLWPAVAAACLLGLAWAASTRAATRRLPAVAMGQYCTWQRTGIGIAGGEGHDRAVCAGNRAGRGGRDPARAADGRPG
jgi:hypothetical protein